jgi:hypothetical protein
VLSIQNRSRSLSKGTVQLRGAGLPFRRRPSESETTFLSVPREGTVGRDAPVPFLESPVLKFYKNKHNLSLYEKTLANHTFMVYACMRYPILVWHRVFVQNI